jgi:hypothetical protein
MHTKEQCAQNDKYFIASKTESQESLANAHKMQCSFFQFSSFHNFEEWK